MILCLLLTSCRQEAGPQQEPKSGDFEGQQETADSGDRVLPDSADDDVQAPSVQFCGEHVHNDHFQTTRDLSHIDVDLLPPAVIALVERNGPPIEEYERRSVSGSQLRLRSASPEFPNRDGNYLIVTRTLVLGLITTGWREEWVIEESEATYPCDQSGNAFDLAQEYEVLEPPEGWEPGVSNVPPPPNPSELLLRRPLTSLADLKIDQLSVLQVATDILSVIMPGCSDPDAYYISAKDRYEQVLPTDLNSTSDLPIELLDAVGESSYRRFDQIDVFQIDEDRVVVSWLPKPEAEAGILVVAELARARRAGDREAAWRFTEYVEVYGCHEGAERDDETWYSGRTELAESDLRLGMGMQPE